MGALSPAHLIIILVVALLVIGPGKLPETAAALGRAIRDFRQAVDSTPEAATPGRSDPTGSTVTPAVAVTSDAALQDPGTLDFV